MLALRAVDFHWWRLYPGSLSSHVTPRAAVGVRYCARGKGPGTRCVAFVGLYGPDARPPASSGGLRHLPICSFMARCWGEAFNALGCHHYVTFATTSEKLSMSTYLRNRKCSHIRVMLALVTGVAARLGQQPATAAGATLEECSINVQFLSNSTGDVPACAQFCDRHSI